jgi:hypothetical protein
MMKARTVLALGSVAAAMLAATTPTASAATDPGTFATARDGNLIVVSSVLVTARRVEMMGGWNNESQSCNVERRLDVEILIDRVRAGNTTRFVDEISAPVQNCAEGGPNLGFQLRASDVGMACATSGKWRPGHYSFVTDTLHRRRGLRAIASLFFTRKDPC